MVCHTRTRVVTPILDDTHAYLVRRFFKCMEFPSRHRSMTYGTASLKVASNSRQVGQSTFSGGISYCVGHGRCNTEH